MKNIAFRTLPVLVVLVTALSCNLPQAVSAQELGEIPAPTIVSLTKNNIVEESPVFTGVTINDTQVSIYIDGTLAGQAKVKNGPQGTASWAYRPETKLALGEHVVTTTAVGASSQQSSSESTQYIFYVELPYPAPTLLDPIVDERTSYDQPWIKGVAKNGSLIDIYVDGQLDGTLQVSDNQSGTASFEYQPKAKLMNGWHSVAAAARDKRGKISKSSDAIVFEVRSDVNSASHTAPQTPNVATIEPTAVAAPTLREPQTGSVTTLVLPLINGLAHNGQAVRVFIDGQLNGEIPPQEHKSGVYSFSYKPFLPLKPGTHVIMAKAVNSAGQQSSPSNSLGILIRPRDTQLVVSPAGVKRTALAQIPGTIASVSTETENSTIADNKGVEEISDEKPVMTEESTEPPLEVKEEAESTMVVEETKTVEKTFPETIVEEARPDEEIKVSGDQLAAEADKLKVTSDESAVETGVVVVGERTTTTAASDSKNTTLVVVLAIAAIIVIGLISWYTSREDRAEAETEEESTAEQGPENPVDEEPKPQSDSVWEEEEVESENAEYSSEPAEEDDFPPPPPPPALGI